MYRAELFDSHQDYYHQAVTGRLIDRHALRSLLRWGRLYRWEREGNRDTLYRSGHLNSCVVYKDIVEAYGVDILTEEEWFDVLERDQPLLTYVPDVLFENVAFAKRLCKSHPSWMRKLPEDCQKEVALEVISENPSNWSKLPQSIRMIEDVCFAAGRKFCGCPPDSRKHNKSCSRKKK
jgi:hypothetical protein